MSYSRNRLRTKVRALNHAPALKHRLNRSLSWLERGNATSDNDAKFVFLWIAFNAAYAIDRRAEIAMHGGNVFDWQRHLNYFDTLVPYDIDRQIYGQLSDELRKPIQSLLRNVYIYRGFWNCLTEQRFNWRNWSNRGEFEEERAEVERLLGYTGTRESRNAKSGVEDTDVIRVLTTLFDRLNVTRNQLMHGCATHDKPLNRSQVDTGAQILASLIPTFFHIMADHPQQDWGAISFPVRDDIREDGFNVGFMR